MDPNVNDFDKLTNNDLIDYINNNSDDDVKKDKANKKVKDKGKDKGKDKDSGKDKSKKKDKDKYKDKDKDKEQAKEKENKIEIGTDIYENLNIMELVEQLDKDIGFENTTTMKKWFEQFNFRLSNQIKEIPNVFLIKYNDNNKVWKPKWARQARGIVFYKCQERKKIFCIKNLLQRGAEMLTQLNSTTSTQDIDGNAINPYDVFDEVQQETLELMKSGSEIEGVLSFKCDGSLVGITMISTKSTIFKELSYFINTYSTDFNRNILSMTLELKLDYFPFINTQGTSMAIISEMQGTILTSILCDWGKVDYQTLTNYLKDKDISTDDFVLNKDFNQIKEFFIMLQGLTLKTLEVKLKKNKIDYDDMITFCFESVNENQTSAWGKVHTELAVTYSKSFLKFLGCIVGHGKSLGKFYGYFDEYLEEEVHKLGLQIPCYWNVTSCITVDEMLKQIECIVHEQSNEESFFKIFPYNNKYPTDNLIDYEGFIFYRFIYNKKNKSNEYEVDYSKIKTQSYYALHKPHINNLDSIFLYGQKAEEIYPKICKVKKTFIDIKLKFVEFFNKVRKEFIDNEEYYFEKLQSFPKKTWKDINNKSKFSIISSNKGTQGLFSPFMFNSFCGIVHSIKENDQTKVLVFQACLEFEAYEPEVMNIDKFNKLMTATTNTNFYRSLVQLILNKIETLNY